MAEFTERGRKLYEAMYANLGVPIEQLRLMTRDDPQSLYAGFIANYPDLKNAPLPVKIGSEQQVVQSVEEKKKDIRMKIVKKENVSPKRSLSPPAAVPAKTPHLTVKTELPAVKQCESCDWEISDDLLSQLKHALKKHRDQVFNFIRPELVCSIGYCDYVGSTEMGTKMHKSKGHGKRASNKKDIVLESGKCTYCDGEIDSLIFLKEHMLKCKKRDQRPMLGCTSCDKTFHFICDFIAHLKPKGGAKHGLPVLLNDKKGEENGMDKKEGQEKMDEVMMTKRIKKEVEEYGEEMDNRDGMEWGGYEMEEVPEMAGEEEVAYEMEEPKMFEEENEAFEGENRDLVEKSSASPHPSMRARSHSLEEEAADDEVLAVQRPATTFAQRVLTDEHAHALMPNPFPFLPFDKVTVQLY